MFCAFALLVKKKEHYANQDVLSYFMDALNARRSSQRKLPAMFTM